ncbi:MAG: cytochrome c biogenesis protein CcsA, partial [Sulfurospirillum sp.]|nr:cytochrome c biogenesis protein CcsA [Sulfurospirillum sp.]
MIILFGLLALGAGVATFIENDFGTLKAREIVYNSLWYEITLFLSSINLLVVIHKTKMYRMKVRFIFHIAFVIILMGAGITRYFGIEGVMSIRENEKSNSFITTQNIELEIPFHIKLRDFELTRYAGSNSPSSFSSEITVIDNINSNTFDKKIFMNNTMSYERYKFFQTSYDTDELGTILSVNKDPGCNITYIGYALLFLGLILTLFDNKSRFRILIKRVQKMPIASFILIFSLFQVPSFANDNYVENYLKKHKNDSKALSKEFGSLVVQTRMGRMKTVDSLNREILNKLTKKSTWQGMSANQVMLGMFSRPEIWKKVPIIKVKTVKLKETLRVPLKQNLFTFSDFFYSNGNYKLARFVEEANRLKSSQRGTFQRDVLKVDERINIAFMVYRGKLLKLFPIPNDEKQKWVDFKTMFTSFNNDDLQNSTRKLLDASFNRNYDKGLVHVESIKMYQNKFGHNVIPSQKKLKTEIWFNKINIFSYLSIIYVLAGLILLIYSLSSIFYNRLINLKVHLVIATITTLLFITHTIALGIRWYISGYIPLSNTYETMIYIAYSSLIAGLFFFRKSLLALSSSFLLAGTFMMSAYLGNIDPVITNLVPVLQSVWLSIHVSVITASYGFLGLGAILGFITLMLFILRSPTRVHIDMHIKNLTNINEITLILGLILLVIGNFLGAIWANESWGRYWGWDPKETWAYISIIIYALVIHVRLLKSIYSPYLFSTLSLLAFSSILMTYFGVNYYLAGMHSYATGDPVPVPIWVYIVALIVLV